MLRTDLGELSDLDAVERLLDVQNLDLVEVGCAGGDTARGLAERGATVLGVEPDPVQAETNRSQPSRPGVTLVEAGGAAVVSAAAGSPWSGVASSVSAGASSVSTGSG